MVQINISLHSMEIYNLYNRMTVEFFYCYNGKLNHSTKWKNSIETECFFFQSQLCVKS